jgi:pyruvate/oxaloacetate carboxyltransferase
MPDTRLQCSMRGQNIVGYRNYADDVVREFVRLAARGRHRCVPLLRRAQRHPQPRDFMAAVRENGKWVEGTISKTMSPVHNIPSFVPTPTSGEARRAEHLHQDMPGCWSRATHTNW